MSKYHTCLMCAVSFAVAEAKTTQIQKLPCKVKIRPKKNMNYNMQEVQKSEDYYQKKGKKRERKKQAQK